ncbi:hypothetical protein DFA_06562 [Cavenderia fasciculata]|uniref:Uncharacterized protein n=1 Tax=Cavenderia fasciculata TaxID=261658 RepID=F4PJC6_CACFS|nr:uncharacterized protein DFA_06562 [Cavenderia fasciculata]EGG24412.1 hypothetical protein DFA_06562 [Cavenderia fasciculata]|eukprot:XP_004362263.1 hypothetical protein DFA_06562 [Cavenderia fasciculata]
MGNRSTLLFSIILFLIGIINGQSCPEIGQNTESSCSGIDLIITNSLEYKNNITVSPSAGTNIFINSGKLYIHFNKNGQYTVTASTGATCTKVLPFEVKFPSLSYTQPTCPFQSTEVSVINYKQGAKVTINNETIEPTQKTTLLPGYHLYTITQDGNTCNYPLNLVPTKPNYLPKLVHETKTCLGPVTSFAVTNKADYTDIKIFDPQSVIVPIVGLVMGLGKQYILSLTSATCVQNIPISSQLLPVSPIVVAVPQCKSPNATVTVTLPGLTAQDIPTKYTYTYKGQVSTGATLQVDRGVLNTILVKPVVEVGSLCPSGFNITLEVPDVPLGIAYTFAPAAPNCINKTSIVQFSPDLSALVLYNNQTIENGTLGVEYGKSYEVSNLCNDEKLVIGSGTTVPQYSYTSNFNTCLSTITFTISNYQLFSSIKLEKTDGQPLQANGTGGVYKLVPGNWKLTTVLQECQTSTFTKDLDLLTNFTAPLNVSLATFNVEGLPKVCSALDASLRVTPVINGLVSTATTTVTFKPGQSTSVPFKYGSCDAQVNYIAPTNLPLFDINPNITIVSPSSCANQNNGTIEIGPIPNTIKVYGPNRIPINVLSVGPGTFIYTAPSGTYNITFELDGTPTCFYQKVITVGIIPKILNPISYDVTPQSLSNCDVITGKITVVNHTDVTSFSLDGQPGATAGTFSGLKPGKYVLRYTRGGCTDSMVEIIVPIEHLPIVVTPIRLPTCSMGDGIAKLNYTLSNGTLIDNMVITSTAGQILGNTLSNIPPDINITATFKKGSQCQWSYTFLLPQNNEPIIDVVTSLSPSYGLKNGELSVTLRNLNYTLGDIKVVPNTLPFVVTSDLKTIRGFDETQKSIDLMVTYNKVCERQMTFPITITNYPLPSYSVSEPTCDSLYGSVILDNSSFVTYDIYLDSEDNKLVNKENPCSPGPHKLWYRFKWQVNAPLLFVPIICPEYSGQPSWNATTKQLAFTTTNETCLNSKDGKVVITQPDSNIDYQLVQDSNSQSIILPSLIGLGKGVYWIRAYKKGSSCYTAVTNVVVGSSEPVLTALPQGICQANSSKLGSVGISFGSGHTFTNTSILVNGNVTVPVDGRVGNLAPGQYQIQVEIHNANCPRKYQPIAIEITKTLLNVSTDTSQKCGQIVVTPSGGNSPDSEYTISISGDTNSEVVLTKPSYTFEGLKNGTYTITVQDEQGCQIESTPIPVIECPPIEKPTNSSSSSSSSSFLTPSSILSSTTLIFTTTILLFILSC